MTTIAVAATITLGFLAALWLIRSIVATALTAATANQAEHVGAVADAVARAAEAVGAGMAKALAPPEQINMPAMEPDVAEAWEDETGRFDADYMDGFENEYGVTGGVAGVTMAARPKGADDLDLAEDQAGV
jgi:hypothetical protein